MSAWCPDCGRMLTFTRIDGEGSCPEHGAVWAEFHEPTLIVAGDGVVLGLASRVSAFHGRAVRWHDLEVEW